MKNKAHNLILFWGFVFLLLLLVPAISKAACTNVPMSGDYTVSSSCTFANTVDGVDDGGITVNTGVTLTVNSGQAIVWSPGHSIVINGAIAIADGGQLKQTYLWMTDADDDNYPSDGTMYAQDTQPTNGKRRKDFTNFTYVSDITADCNDSNSYVYRNKTVGTDTDQDGYIAESSTSSQCVGASTSIGGKTYYKDDSGNYTKLSPSHVVGYSDCNDSNSSKWVLKYKDADGDNYCASSIQYCVGNDSGYRSSCSDYSDCSDSDSARWQNRTCYYDGDNDGYRTTASATRCVGANCTNSTDAYKRESSASVDCNDSNASLYVNRTCYPDSDGDSHYAKTGTTICSGASCPSGYSGSKGDDCCDSDNRAYPGQTQYFTSKNACNSWDYNCNGNIEKFSCTYKHYSLSGTSKYCFGTVDDCNAGVGSARKTYPNCTNVTYSLDCGEIGHYVTCRTTGYKYCPTACSSATRYPSVISGGTNVTCKCR